VDAALQTDAAEVLVGDAPIQGCDFNALIQTTGLDAGRASGWLRNLASKACAIFRRTTCVLVHGVRVAEENIHDIGITLLSRPDTDARPDDASSP